MTACWRNDPVEPVEMTPISPSATPTTIPTPTPLPTDTPAPTVTVEEDEVASGENGVEQTTEVTASSAVETTEDEATSARDENGNCRVDTSLDLIGYPDLNESMGCALEEASNGDIAINEFGPGPDFDRFMLWLSNTREIYVLLPNETWQTFPDTWTEEEPEILCNPLGLDPPTSPPLPRRGFGKLWCTVDELQELMGEIVREERLCQHTVTQRFEEGVVIGCFEDATIRYFRILDSGGWYDQFVQ
ncbi:hypothetical protein KFU94_37520 [Chloroflexi bacterium TSY]|nr:hypothetical protein [Chloroflexi bacterium TSY]